MALHGSSVVLPQPSCVKYQQRDRGKLYCGIALQQLILYCGLITAAIYGLFGNGCQQGQTGVYLELFMICEVFQKKLVIRAWNLEDSVYQA